MVTEPNAVYELKNYMEQYAAANLFVSFCGSVTKVVLSYLPRQMHTLQRGFAINLNYPVSRYSMLYCGVNAVNLMPVLKKQPATLLFYYKTA